jgi:hypothetical protein
VTVLTRVKYVQSATELTEHWKVDLVAESLGISYAQAVGHLHLLWWFAANATKDSQDCGDLSRFTAAQIERRMKWSGETGRLFDVLVEAGWIDVDGESKTVHDWAEHSGAGVVRLLSKAARMREYRARSVAAPEHHSGATVPLPISIDAPTPVSAVIVAKGGGTRVAKTAEVNPAIRILRELLGVNPTASVREAIEQAVANPSDSDLERLRECAGQWRLRGYNPRNVSGVLEWFSNGIPATPGRQPKNSAGGMREVGSRLERVLGSEYGGETGRPSRFARAVGERFSATQFDGNGSRSDTPRLLGSGAGS